MSLTVCFDVAFEMHSRLASTVDSLGRRISACFRHSSAHLKSLKAPLHSAARLPSDQQTRTCVITGLDAGVPNTVCLPCHRSCHGTWKTSGWCVYCILNCGSSIFAQGRRRSVVLSSATILVGSQRRRFTQQTRVPLQVALRLDCPRKTLPWTAEVWDAVTPARLALAHTF